MSIQQTQIVFYYMISIYIFLFWGRRNWGATPYRAQGFLLDLRIVITPGSTWGPTGSAKGRTEVGHVP